MSDFLLFRVYGSPAPQGSKRHVGNGVMVESSAKTKPWRIDVKSAALDEIERTGFPQLLGPVELRIVFTLARPKAHYRTGLLELRHNAPTLVSKRPDIDKLTRSTCDALGEAGVWQDDSQVALLNVSKCYEDALTRPGALITVSEATR